MNSIKRFTALSRNAASIQSNLSDFFCSCFGGVMEAGRTEGVDLLFNRCSKGLKKGK